MRTKHHCGAAAARDPGTHTLSVRAEPSVFAGVAATPPLLKDERQGRAELRTWGQCEVGVNTLALSLSPNATIKSGQKAWNKYLRTARYITG